MPSFAKAWREFELRAERELKPPILLVLFVCRRCFRRWWAKNCIQRTTALLALVGRTQVNQKGTAELFDPVLGAMTMCRTIELISTAAEREQLIQETSQPQR